MGAQDKPDHCGGDGGGGGGGGGGGCGGRGGGGGGGDGGCDGGSNYNMGTLPPILLFEG